MAIFGVILSKIWPKIWISSIFGSKWPQKWPKIKKYQKSKKQVLFVFQNASFWPKMRKYGQNGEEYICLEGNFQTPQILGFPIHFADFREIRRDFAGSYLGTTVIFFNSVKSSWIPIFHILEYVKTKENIFSDPGPPPPTPQKFFDWKLRVLRAFKDKGKVKKYHNFWKPYRPEGVKAKS